jgi:hypothetical protein
MKASNSISIRDYIKQLDTSNLISIEDYIEQFDSKYSDYITRLSRPCSEYTTFQQGMLKWKDSPENWSPPFEGDYVLCGYREYKEDKLSSISEILREYKLDVERSNYNVPYSVKERLGMNVKGYWDIELYGKPSYRTKLTDEEKQLVNEACNSLEAVEYEMKKLQNLLNGDVLNTISKEKPCHIYLCGLDDCSYSYVGNKEDSEGVFDRIVRSSYWHVLKDLGFYFSN